jgi:hypothetical protein
MAEQGTGSGEKNHVGNRSRLPNKRMQLTKLRAAPERQDKVPPCAPAGGKNGGTASQLIRRVGQTMGWGGGT